MPSRLRLFSVCLGLLLLPACGPAPSTTTTATDAEGDAPAPTTPMTPGAPPTAKATGRGLLVRPEQKTLAGKWGLVITQLIPERNNNDPMFRDLCLLLIELSDGGEAGWTGKIIAAMPGANDFTLEAVRVNHPNIELDLASGEQTLKFQGKLADGLVRGSVSAPNSNLSPAMMQPTDETTYTGWDPAPISSGVERFARASLDKNQPQALLDAANELRGTPLALTMYEGIVGRMGQYPNLDEKTLRTIARDYIDMAKLWGPEMTAQARLNVALGVIMLRRFPEFGQELLTAAEAEEAQQKPEWKEPINYAKEQIALDIGLKKLKSKEAADQKAGNESLTELLSKQRYNPELLDALAIYAEKTGQKPLAKQYFAEIVSLPLLEGMWQQMRAGQPPGDPTPRERLLKLWEDEHGNLDGFDQFLTETQQQRIAELKEQTLQQGPPQVPADQQQRTVLVELFTGTACPPCVGSDLALSVLQQTYPSPQTIVLQYHQHVPGPDPLSNLDTEDRSSYYEVGGNPFAFIDGKPLPGVGGLLQHVTRVYNTTRTAVDERLKVAATAKLALSAKVDGDELVVEAAASDFPAEEETAAKLRMRLAIVEPEVAFVAPNGIRRHDGVVRKLLSGAKGIGVKSGRLAYSLRMPAADIRQDLANYLADFESGRNYTFLVKPLKLEGLTLVGWVQNDETREILGTAIVPIEGWIASEAK